MKTPRTQRLGSEYQKEIAAILSGALKDKEPLLKGLISVTGADVASDLKTAKIYVSIFTPTAEEKERSFLLIKQNAGFIRHELSKVMKMRTVPFLTFILDGSMEYGSKMDEILAKLHKD